MRFGPVPLDEAEGAILAHSVAVGSGPGSGAAADVASGEGGRAGRIRKGVALTGEDVSALRAAGLREVTVARLDPGDLHEDAAAERVAAALMPDPDAAGMRATRPFAGRVNLLSNGPGVAELDAQALGRINGVNPMITVATLPPYQQVATGTMVATIKIISYGVPQSDVERAAGLAGGALRVLPPVLRSAGLVMTETSATGPGGGKGRAAVSDRLEALGMELADFVVVPHRVDALAGALDRLEGDLAMVLTGSATSDVGDVAPEAVRRAGGRVDRFGMPVDPGNLLFVGALGNRPVIGLPGCARSPALNGADWVLSRIACGVPVTGEDIAAMGVGGLLKEIPTRPQPRERKSRAAAAAAPSAPTAPTAPTLPDGANGADGAGG